MLIDTDRTEEENKGREMKFTKDSTTFETDLKYYRELFRLRDMQERNKYDYFWGPHLSLIHI